MELVNITKFNDWWTTKKVREDLLKPYKRPLFSKIIGYIKDRQILLIMGLRRVGKTTLFYQLIQELLDRGTNPLKILYFSFDEETGGIKDLLETYKEKVLKAGFENTGRVYVFLDEIQKSKKWQDELKVYYDLYPNLKFFISGSASVGLQKNSKESLAGRIYDFILQPLDFEEFLELKNIKIGLKGKALKTIELYKHRLTPLFYDYLRKGGFPEISDETDDEKIKSYIKNSVIERIIYRDLPIEFGLKDVELLKTLVEMFAKNPGMILNYDNLSEDLKRNKRTIINYVNYLEYAMVLRIVHNYRKGFVVSSRKLRKVYLTNSAFSFALVDNFYSESFLEKIVEGLAVNETDAKNYYRNSYEVDMVVKTKKGVLPIEVKYGKIETKGLLKFLKEFKINRGIIVTNQRFEERRVDNKKISLFPVWAFLLLADDLVR